MNPAGRLAFSFSIALICSATLLVGCGPAVGEVSGSVTVDGKPLASGVISYVPAEGSGEPVTATIADGKYRLETTAGKKFVQISAPVIVGKRKEYEGPDAPLVEITDESLPPRYNSQTELSLEVKRGSNVRDWNLSKSAK